MNRNKAITRALLNAVRFQALTWGQLSDAVPHADWDTFEASLDYLVQRGALEKLSNSKYRRATLTVVNGKILTETEAIIYG